MLWGRLVHTMSNASRTAYTSARRSTYRSTYNHRLQLPRFTPFQTQHNPNFLTYPNQAAQNANTDSTGGSSMPISIQGAPPAWLRAATEYSILIWSIGHLLLPQPSVPVSSTTGAPVTGLPSQLLCPLQPLLLDISPSSCLLSPVPPYRLSLGQRNFLSARGGRSDSRYLI